MPENPPTLDEWRRLYEAAARLKEMAPWEWMEETDIFGVQSPETGDLGFDSVMGTLGEHLAVTVYLGPKGLYDFLDLEGEGPVGSPYRVLEIPQLQVSFEDRKFLKKEDREVLKALRLKFRGQNAWPLFRSYRPGFFPWFLESREARFLACALEQVLDVAPRFRRKPSLLYMPEGRYLVRVPSPGGINAWEDRTAQVPPPTPSPIEVIVDDLTRKRVEGLPQGKHKVEVDVFMFPEPCREGKERPFYPYNLMIVHAQSGMVLGADILDPRPSMEEMWRSVPAKLFHQFAKAGFVPAEILVRSGHLFDLLKPFAGEFRFKLRQSERLPSLDPARDFMFQSLGLI